MRARVSIIMPAYNMSRYVARAIRSAQAQTVEDIEILVVDDCSTDDTADIVRSLARQDTRIKLLRTPANGGCFAAWNYGAAHATGEWLVLLDADDQCDPHRLAKSLAVTEQHEVDAVATNQMLCDEDGLANTPMFSAEELAGYPGPLTGVDFVKGNIMGRKRRVSFGFFKPIIRRVFLEKNKILCREEFRFGADYLFSLETFLAGCRWWLIPEPLYLYTIRSSSETANVSPSNLAGLIAAETELLKTPAAVADPALSSAMRQHIASMSRALTWLSFAQAVKRRDARAASRSMFQNAESFVHVSRESVYLLTQKILPRAPSTSARSSE